MAHCIIGAGKVHLSDVGSDLFFQLIRLKQELQTFLSDPTVFASPVGGRYQRKCLQLLVNRILRTWPWPIHTLRSRQSK